jgi:hypothetical protein
VQRQVSSMNFLMKTRLVRQRRVSAAAFHCTVHGSASGAPDPSADPTGTLVP